MDEFCSITDNTYDKAEVNMQCYFYFLWGTNAKLLSCLLFVSSFLLTLVFMVIGDI